MQVKVTIDRIEFNSMSKLREKTPDQNIKISLSANDTANFNDMNQSAIYNNKFSIIYPFIQQYIKDEFRTFYKVS